MPFAIHSPSVPILARLQSSSEAVQSPQRKNRARKQNSQIQMNVEDARASTKKLAILRAQQSGATGNFMSMDSEFNNFLIPVIPFQMLEKPKTVKDPG
ncbi:hypothetical protein KP509_13G024700 [Ceratopteris richardii]|nr:hypothetical protein KP509_13G024700 [Ceratopteris richardii]